MKRCSLICLFLGVGLSWAGAADANHLGPLTSPDDAREEIYNRIMTSTSLDESRISRPNLSPDYSSRKKPKTLVVCINWDATSHYSIGYIRSYSFYRRWKGESKRTAMFTCKNQIVSYSGDTCEDVDGYTCEVVDEDGKNVLVVPEDVIARYAPN